jgi:hypothetical protein
LKGLELLKLLVEVTSQQLHGVLLSFSARSLHFEFAIPSQDGFGLNLHGFFVTDHGKWTEVQQGMHAETRGRLAGITGIPGT